MRLNIVRKKNDTFYYVIESLPNGSTRTYEKIGSHSSLLSLTDDPLSYAKNRVHEINESMKNEVMTFKEEVDFGDELPSSEATVSSSTVRNVGWLYLNELYEKLGIDQFLGCVDTQRKYDLDAIDRHLVMNQILNPGSKLSAFGNLDRYQSIKRYDLHQSYRFLSDLDSCGEKLQAHLFRKTKDIVDLDTSVLMYDLTNFYFETEEADIDFLDGDNILQYGFRKYGHSKENRPNPIVQMGLFVEKNGIPISFTVERGNVSEQETVLPMERNIIKNYRHSSYIYCSDAGLNSYAIRMFNVVQGCNYVVSHSLKKTAQEELDLIFKDSNWLFMDNDQPVSLEEFRAICQKAGEGKELDPQEEALLRRDIIYKKFPSKHAVDIASFAPGAKVKGSLELEEILYVTFSAKYFLYQRKILSKQVMRASDWIEKGCRKGKKQTDPSRLIHEENVTPDGEVASIKVQSIDQDEVSKEERFHGFYAVATDLDRGIREILEINSNRWRIEYCFRIMKSFFETRPMYVYTESHIKGHLTVCYQALLIFRILCRKLEENGYCFTVREVLNTLKNMNVQDHDGRYYESCYTDSKVLQALEKCFGLSLNRKKYKMSRFD